MKNYSYLPIIISCFFCDLSYARDSYARDSIIVVANIQNKPMELSRQEIRNLFMGSSLDYPLTAIALPPQNQTRVLFNTRVVGLTEARIQSYWAQMRFTGRKKPPKELSNEKLVLAYLKNNEGFVGYLPSDTDIPNELTILFEIE